jgi:hypothetical protein
LLRGLQPIQPAAFEATVARQDADVRDAHERARVATAAAAPPTQRGASEPTSDPKRFLLRVMNDESVALALRIEAAKALLSYTS